jgi:hypothetical protein
MLIKTAVYVSNLVEIGTGFIISSFCRGQNKGILSQVKQCVCQTAEDPVINFMRGFVLFADKELVLLYR